MKRPPPPARSGSGSRTVVADIDFSAPLYLKLPELQTDPPAAVECPACFAIVLAARLDDHRQAAHG